MAEAGEPLTERELEVVRLLATGASNKEIAGALTVSPNTVKVHLRNIFVKLEADSRTSVTMMAVRNGWVPGAPAVRAISAETAGQPAGTTAAVVETAADPIASRPAAVVEAPGIGVRAAPNPLPLPRLGAFRRLTMAVGLAATVLGAALGVPARETATAASPISLRQDSGVAGSGLRFPGESSRWFERARLPTPREFASAATVGDQVFLIGGVANGQPTGDILVYDAKANTWTTVPASKPTAVGLASAASIGNRIYVSGGLLANDTPTNRVEAFDTATGAWVSLAALPVPLAGHASAAIAERLYVVGGYSAAGPSADTFEYDPQTNMWKRMATMPAPRVLLAAAAFGNRLYAIGGQADGQERSDCQSFAPADNAWTPCARMALRRSAFGLAASGGALIAVGGGGTTFLGFSERYDPARDTWTLFETPKLGDWRNIAVAPVRSGVLVAGGRAGSERLRDTLVFEFGGNRAFLPALTQQQQPVP